MNKEKTKEIELINNNFQFNKFYWVKHKGVVKKIKLWRVWGSLDANGEFCERYWGFYFLEDYKDQERGRPIFIITSTGLIKEKKEDAIHEIKEYTFSSNNAFKIL